MKFTQAGAGNGRVQMRERHRRDRASTPEIRVLFPQFATLRFEFEFKDGGPFPPTPQVTVMHPPARAYFLFPCPHSDCDGEFDLRAAVEKVTDAGSSECVGELACTGQRRIDSKTRSGCAVVLRYRIQDDRG
jgi:hypothetical protein